MEQRDQGTTRSVNRPWIDLCHCFSSRKDQTFIQLAIQLMVFQSLTDSGIQFRCYCATKCSIVCHVTSCSQLTFWLYGTQWVLSNWIKQIRRLSIHVLPCIVLPVHRSWSSIPGRRVLVQCPHYATSQACDCKFPLLQVITYYPDRNLSTTGSRMTFKWMLLLDSITCNFDGGSFVDYVTFNFSVLKVLMNSP